YNLQHSPSTDHILSYPVFARQAGFAHQKFIGASGSFTAFRYCPDYPLAQVLAPWAQLGLTCDMIISPPNLYIYTVTSPQRSGSHTRLAPNGAIRETEINSNI